MAAKGVDQSEADIISERLRANLLNSGLFRVMERGQMDAILKEQVFQQSGVCADQACLVEMGQLLGVQQVLAGTVGKIGKTYTLEIHLIDVATGEILVALNSDCQCPIDEVMQKSTQNIVKQLAQKISAGPPESPPAPPAAAAPAPAPEPKSGPPEKKVNKKKVLIITGAAVLVAGGVLAAYLLWPAPSSTAPVQVQIP